MAVLLERCAAVIDIAIPRGSQTVSVW